MIAGAEASPEAEAMAILHDRAASLIVAAMREARESGNEARASFLRNAADRMNEAAFWFQQSEAVRGLVQAAPRGMVLPS